MPEQPWPQADAAFEPLSVSADNHVQMRFLSRSENEGLARVAVGAFIAPLDPTMEELADIQTAVSEAVTNAILHGYPDQVGWIYLQATRSGREVSVKIRDYGTGIADIEAARQPFFTTRPDLDRSGMGFSIMESFCDSVEIHSSPGMGTEIVLHKRFSDEPMQRG